MQRQYSLYTFPYHCFVNYAVWKYGLWGWSSRCRGSYCYQGEHVMYIFHISHSSKYNTHFTFFIPLCHDLILLDHWCQGLWRCGHTQESLLRATNSGKQVKCSSCWSLLWCRDEYSCIGGWISWCWVCCWVSHICHLFWSKCLPQGWFRD